MLIALAQINSTVGDLSANARKMIEVARQAADKGSDLVLFPELSLTGYPPRDLVEKDSFLRRTEEELVRLAEQTRGLSPTLICGFVGRSAECKGKRASNSAVVLQRGEMIFRQDKMLLPTYDVFDEARYFIPAERQHLVEIGGKKCALAICEDAWNPLEFSPHPPLYERDPVAELIDEGGEIVLSINASPYFMGKRELRKKFFGDIARHRRVPVLYVNQVGGNDQLIFDGSSFALNAAGETIAEGASFAEDLVYVDLRTGEGDHKATARDEVEAAYEALVLGCRDYIRKCGFLKTIIGLSGGIDSSLVAAIAVDAVGSENVTGVGMPGPYSSPGSITDAKDLANNLGVRFEVVSINEPFEEMRTTIKPLLRDLNSGVAEENLQSRLRGVTLMALSNASGALVLTTGNKSELAVGYCTLYGDMCGGLAVISDVPKTLVYELCRIANQRHPGAIPETVFTKPPSAELRADQKDTDSLPEYDLLDRILKGYVEDYLAPETIAASVGAPLDLVRDIINKVDRNEYKRQQAAPGLKITSKAFGVGRRFPIAQGFRE